MEWDRSERRGCLSQSTSTVLMYKMLCNFVSQFERYIGTLKCRDPNPANAKYFFADL